MLVLRVLAPEIARVTHPAALAPVVLIRGLDHAPPPVNSGRRDPPHAAPAAGGDARLPPHDVRRLRPAQGAYPPRHQPPGAPPAPRFQRPELKPRLILAMRLPR